MKTLNMTLNMSENELKELIIEKLNEDGYDVKPNDIKFNIELKGFGMKGLIPIFKGCSIHNVKPAKYTHPLQKRCTHTDFENKSAFRETGAGEFTCAVCGYVERR